MLFSTTTDIRRILFNSSDNLEVVLPVRGLEDVRAIDYDVNSHLIYWIDSAAKEIRRSFQNGSNAKTIVLGEDSSPYDLAIDSYGQQLYWTDNVKNSINVYSLRKGVSMGVVFHERDVHPRSIVLYPEMGWVNLLNSFWFILFSLVSNPLSSGLLHLISVPPPLQLRTYLFFLP